MIADSLPLRAIAEAVGTPYYCYSADHIRNQFRRLRTALPTDFRYLYSVKANPNRSIVETLRREGLGCEVCSLCELETALSAKVPARDIIFVGPGKSKHDLSRCVQLGIKAIAVESIAELAIVDGLAGVRGVIQPIALRVNPDRKAVGAKLVMSPADARVSSQEALRFLTRAGHVLSASLDPEQTTGQACRDTRVPTMPAHRR